MDTIYKAYDFLKGDKAIWLIVILLGLFSILAVYSATGSMAYKLRDGNTEYYLIQQFVFVILGFTLLFFSYRLNYNFYSKLAPILLIIAIPLLVFTLFYGIEVNEARRWLTIPWIDKTFQVSDFAKIALIVYVARAIGKKQEYIKDLNQAFVIIIPVILVCGLIAPADFSTAGLLFVTYAYQVAFPGGSGRFDLPLASAMSVMVAVGAACIAFLMIRVNAKKRVVE